MVFLLIIILSLIYNKLVYIFLFLYFFDYVWFIVFVTSLIRNRNNYFYIKIRKIDVYTHNTLEVWIEYSKMMAFIKLYLFLRQKKICIKDIMLVLILFLFNIPVGVLRLLIFFVKNNGSLRDKILLLYSKTYFKIEGRKIEILKKKIYLNGDMSNKLFKLFSLNKNNINYLLELKNLEEKIMGTKIDAEKIELIYAKVDRRVKIFHPTYIQGNNTIHATSNIQFNKLINQYTSKAVILGAYKDGTDPGVVVTKNIKYLDIDGFKRPEVNKTHIDMLKYEFRNDFELDKKDFEDMKWISDAYGELNEKHNIIGSYESFFKQKAGLFRYDRMWLDVDYMISILDDV